MWAWSTRLLQRWSLSSAAALPMTTNEQRARVMPTLMRRSSATKPMDDYTMGIRFSLGCPPLKVVIPHLTGTFRWPQGMSWWSRAAGRATPAVAPSDGVGYQHGRSNRQQVDDAGAETIFVEDSDWKADARGAPGVHPQPMSVIWTAF